MKYSLQLYDESDKVEVPGIISIGTLPKIPQGSHEEMITFKWNTWIKTITYSNLTMYICVIECGMLTTYPLEEIFCTFICVFPMYWKIKIRKF